MSEINNNNKPINYLSLSNNYNTSFKGAEKPVQAEQKIEKKINDLGNNPKDYIGRSQTKRLKIDGIPFNGALALNIKNDLKTLNNNPELVAQSDLMFEEAVKKHGYDKAVAMQLDFVNEFKK